MPLTAPSKKVLVAPLDWGLGHATRCIPIVHEFLSRGCEVQLASSGSALILLQQEFPTLKFHSLVSYRARYSKRIPLMLKILFQMPKFLRVVRKEHQMIEHIIEHETIDLLLSDNRYGCWSRKIPCVLITHQINILMPPAWKWLEGIINRVNHRQIKKFTECWVPDFANGITGMMTRTNKLNVRFIGMLSRFKKMKVDLLYDVVGIISGPEPQRSVFENIVREQFEKSTLNWFLVKGLPEVAIQNERKNEINFMSANALNELIESARLIICRSGYTTIMDLQKLEKKAIFVPTPDQIEQEYLAEELQKNQLAFFQNQSDFDLKEALTQSQKYSGFEGYPHSANLLAQAIESIFSKL